MAKRLYECVFAASGSLNEAAVGNLVKNFSSAFEENGIEVKKQESWGSLSLAYKISKHTKASYFAFFVESEPESLLKFKKTLKHNRLILRYLIQAKKESEVYMKKDGISLKMPKAYQKEKSSSNKSSTT